MRRSFFLFLWLTALTTMAQRADYRVIPLPKSVQTDTAQIFMLEQGMGITYDAQNEEVARTARFLQEWVKQATGLELQLTPEDSKATIRLILDKKEDKKSKKGKHTPEMSEQELEAYSITVNNTGVVIHAWKPVGLFHAAQTLRKSLPVSNSVKAVGQAVQNMNLMFGLDEKAGLQLKASAF